jgi:hypothetical protein
MSKSLSSTSYPNGKSSGLGVVFLDLERPQARVSTSRFELPIDRFREGRRTSDGAPLPEIGCSCDILLEDMGRRPSNSTSQGSNKWDISKRTYNSTWIWRGKPFLRRASASLRWVFAIWATTASLSSSLDADQGSSRREIRTVRWTSRSHSRSSIRDKSSPTEEGKLVKPVEGFVVDSAIAWP